MLRCLALAVLFTGSIRIAPLSSTVLDADIWWHLRGGDAIVAQHAVPHHGVFSQYAERPWVEYSWGFEVLASCFYHWFGLMGLVVLRATLQVIISAALFVILLRGLRSFWQAWALTVFGMWAIHHCFGMQPMLISSAEIPAAIRESKAEEYNCVPLMAHDLGYLSRARLPHHHFLHDKMGLNRCRLPQPRSQFRKLRLDQANCFPHHENGLSCFLWR
ncbi:MAG: hypothetical protein JWN74_1759 [Acidobacteriaceae bacterium]|nr:hypothetical protein [Acidobacteriaceae bacterium]